MSALIFKINNNLFLLHSLQKKLKQTKLKERKKNHKKVMPPNRLIDCIAKCMRFDSDDGFQL